MNSRYKKHLRRSTDFRLNPIDSVITDRNTIGKKRLGERKESKHSLDLLCYKVDIIIG